MSQSSGSGDAVPGKAKELTGKVLNFLSTASNETIGACVVGLGAVTYLVLGRFGLVLIGAVGGVVLHATWENQPTGSSKEAGLETRRRKEVGLDIVSRLLDLQERRRRENDAGDVEDPRTETELALAVGTQLNFEDYPPETAAALNQIVDATIRDYVKWWYSPILPQEIQFPFACRQTLVGFLRSMSIHVSRKRPADTFLNFVINSTSMFTVFLSELSHALMAPGMYDRDATESLRIYLEEKPESSLANLLDREQQKRKFNLVAKDILETFLDSKAYNCEPVRAFLQQTLAGLILQPMLKTCSQAPWINEWIIYLLEDGETELMNAIDAGVGSATGADTSRPPAQPSSQSEQERKGHGKKPSETESAMEAAMAEVKRLNEMIADEEARKQQERDTTETVSLVAPDQVATPTSSQSGRQSNEVDVASIPQEPPREEASSENAIDEPAPEPQRAFTSFDQILPPQQPSPDPSEPPPLTLHHAKVTIFDDEKPGEKGTIRSKPNIEYLLQIEPASSQHRGWMAARKFPDFETLHEFTSRVAKISGITAFSQAHPTAPAYKGKTKAVLRQDLEKYLRDALSHEGLAESEGMKRFLEKEQALGRPTPTKGVLGFPTPEAFQTMGKGMIDVMSSAPKGIAGSGQAVFKGVSGVFGAQKRQSTGRPQGVTRTDSAGTDRQSMDASPSMGSSSSFQARASQDLAHDPAEAAADTLQLPPALPRRPSSIDTKSSAGLGVLTEDHSPESDSQSSSIVDVSRPASHVEPSEPASSADAEPPMNLPPPPSEITDDYGSLAGANPANPWNNAKTSTSPTAGSTTAASTITTSTTDTATTATSAATEPALSSPSKPKTIDVDPVSNAELSSPPKPKSRAVVNAPLNEQEAQVAIELLFAVINELYQLSSAWQIRRTLLNTAKAFLLRPGNASLESIRSLMQESVIEANASDGGIASLLLKTRVNSLPTEEEFAAWPALPDEEQREKLRVQARKLLVERGMPQALTSVMGAAASSEALGRLFDALQYEEVARGLMFALMLQGIRAVTH